MTTPTPPAESIYTFIYARLDETPGMPGRDHARALVEANSWLHYLPDMDCPHTYLVYGIASLFALHPDFQKSWTPTLIDQRRRPL